MLPTPIVTTVTAQINFSEGKLENYFNQLDGRSRSFEHFNVDGLEAIKTRSAEISATGSVQIIFVNRKTNALVCIELPTTTDFLLTGVKGKDEIYTVAFAASMS